MIHDVRIFNDINLTVFPGFSRWKTSLRRRGRYGTINTSTTSLQPHFLQFITVGLSCCLWRSQSTSWRSRWGREGWVAHTPLPEIPAECSLQNKNPKHSNNTSLMCEILSFNVESENLRSRWGPGASVGQCWAVIESVLPCVQTRNSGTDRGLSWWCCLFFFRFKELQLCSSWIISFFSV